MRKSTLIVFLIFLIIFVKNITNPLSYIPSNLELDLIHTRQEYLGQGLGKIYKNRYGLILFNSIYPKFIKFESNFFSDLSRRHIYVLIYLILLYAGIKKFNGK
jgi:hypothetical protein